MEEAAKLMSCYSYVFVWIAVAFRDARLEGASWIVVFHLLQSWVTLCETSLRRVQLALCSSAYQGPQNPSSLKSVTCSERWKRTVVLCQRRTGRKLKIISSLDPQSFLFGNLFSFVELSTQAREL